MNYVYDNGVQDDNCVLLARMNEKCKVSVKTPVCVTDEFVLENIEIQGQSLYHSNVLPKWMALERFSIPNGNIYTNITIVVISQV